MRPILACLAGVLAFSIVALAVGCSQDNEALLAADSSIGIETSQLFVTLENKSGGPLVDLVVTVQTGGAPYTYRVWRMEAAEKRDIPLSSFSSRDGTSLNLRMVRPTRVQVAAADLTQKKYEAQARWK
jgi:hypothetical protein